MPGDFPRPPPPAAGCPGTGGGSRTEYPPAAKGVAAGGPAWDTPAVATTLGVVPATRLSMQAQPVLLPANGYHRERWRNGAGWTREIARGDRPDGKWDWRVSIAEIDAPSGFSRFDGVDREQVLLSGGGLSLEMAGGTVLLGPPHGRHRYPGEEEVRGVPIDGPVRAFNLMWHRGRIGAALWHRPLVGSMVLFAEPGSTWLLYLMAGQARLGAGGSGVLLEAGDSMLVRAGTERVRQQLDGHGEALVLRLAPVEGLDQ